MLHAACTPSAASDEDDAAVTAAVVRAARAGSGRTPTPERPRLRSSGRSSELARRAPAASPRLAGMA